MVIKKKLYNDRFSSYSRCPESPMGCPVFPPGFLLGTDFLNSSKRRKSKRYCPIGTEKIREVAHILLITVVQYILPHSQPVKSYTVTANSVRDDPALP